ncbi:hypothetical protein K6W16_05070 [Burkholderia dolosa]|uniref:Uncharacterized protein n=1 Tax=Burkholderia dolosa TaxID=152500 RepID=A0A892HV38_9BURK|nr:MULTISPECIES: hypothetical protein [Burkholderia]ETP66891.1 hypothetical protein BDSB_12885 [Burkholderia dolosa PC543]MBR8417824.1 hypothetical protein [Burkholderia dolosa]MBY4656357.1 hypothetical protein [Burkholderia dolosa]MBY4687592.1 hypothetical protein [Burkholderia dolosa]MBY4782882.1 hypothetical protein [Burkholderia dolosa]
MRLAQLDGETENAPRNHDAVRLGWDGQASEKRYKTVRGHGIKTAGTFAHWARRAYAVAPTQKTSVWWRWQGLRLKAVEYAVQVSADGDALRQRSVIGGSKPFTLQPM